jgi:hemolysin activation/secretion protein
MPRSILAFLIATIGLTWLHCLPKQASASVPQITVKRFQFNGNTAFTNAELEAVIEPWRNQPIAFEELLKAHEAITEHYLKAGYLTSFALIPAQLNQQVNADAATITIQVVEGTIASVETIQPTPLAKTIAKRISKDQIFNQNRLLEQLQFLRLEPGVRDLQAELLPGDAPGLSRLQLNILPAPQFELIASINNQNSADTGKLQRGLSFQWEHPLGISDRLTGTFNNTKGGNTWDLGYRLSLDPSAKTQFGIDYRNIDQKVVRPPFDMIDIRNKATSLNLNIDRAILQRVDDGTMKAAKIGATFSSVNSRSFILNRPFPLTLESNDEGQLQFSVLRLFQEYQQRNAQSALAIRSQFNIGLPWGSTTGANGVDGQFFSWQGQALLNRSTNWGEWKFRWTGQISDDALPSYEEIDASGMRGYPSNFIRGRSGFLLCNELKIPLQRSQQHGLFLIPFADVGIAWPQNYSAQTLAATGLGLEWQTPIGLSAQINYEIPLIQNSIAPWQNPQLNFSVQFKSAF